MWQKAVKPYVDAGKMVAIGVVQEQHPDRTRLYRQWRELDWPLFVDSMNVVDHVTVVPIPMGIDEHGVIAYSRFNPRQLEEFLASETAPSPIPLDYNRAPEPELKTLARNAVKLQTSQAWRALGAARFNYGGEEALGQAVAALERAVQIDSGDGAAQFALGTALRRRYETASRQTGDAQAAVRHWGAALEADPNHYIRRRRLQQYGPRLDKPYNFYFWVAQARQDIRARGEEPVVLAAEPMGSEIAAPQRKPEKNSAVRAKNRDPKGRINRDEKDLVVVEPLVTPARVRPGHRVRARLTFRLNEETHPLWNNEADDLNVWVELGDGLTLAEHRLEYVNPEQPETRELRQLEFEVAVGENVPEGEVTLPAYALYYVCEDEGGVCYYLRRDLEVRFTVDKSAPTLR